VDFGWSLSKFLSENFNLCVEKDADEEKRTYDGLTGGGDCEWGYSNVCFLVWISSKELSGWCACLAENRGREKKGMWICKGGQEGRESRMATGVERGFCTRTTTPRRVQGSFFWPEASETKKEESLKRGSREFENVWRTFRISSPTIPSQPKKLNINILGGNDYARNFPLFIKIWNLPPGDAGFSFPYFPSLTNRISSTIKY